MNLSFQNLTSAALSLIMSNDLNQPRHYDPVSPLGNDSKRTSPDQDDEKETQISVNSRSSSTSSLEVPVKTPRTARFAEATSVHSPIDPSTRSPFADPHIRTTYLMPQPQPSDVGFGYVSDNQPSKHSSYAGVEVPLTPNSPLRSALKPPGTPARFANPLSPTFKEEEALEKQEAKTEKQNAADLVKFLPVVDRNELTPETESENSGANGKDGFTRGQL